MIDNILDALAKFRAEASSELFKVVFGKPAGEVLWETFKRYDGDVIYFYTRLVPEDQTLFQIHLALNLPWGTYAHEPPACAECGEVN